MRIVRLLPEVMRGIMHRQTDAIAQGRITAPQYVVLDLLKNQGPLKMSELSAALGISLPGTTGIVDRLVKMGAVQRLLDEKDRRVVRIIVSPAGEKIVNTVRAQRIRVFETIFTRLPEADGKAFVRILENMNDILHRQPKA